MCWIAASYAVSNPLAFAVTLLIGACYVAGALELRRYQQASATLAKAAASLSAPPARLGDWLDALPAGLRSAVRLRIEGERVALPGPALTPYLVGLLVLLGMLGTLLGMVVTLRGTGAALESATDLYAIRASLAAPVKGLGFAFGTSIAGVASSAMLGLLSALCRRERIEAAQQLDAKIATSLRAWSPAHQREETLRLLERQSGLMPALVDRLQSVMAAVEAQSEAANTRQLANQQAFLDKAEAAFEQLAASVGQSLRESAGEGAKAAGAVLQPVVEATMAGLARETAALHAGVTQAVERQLSALSSGFDKTASGLAHETAALHASVTQAVERQLEALSSGFDKTTSGLAIETAALHAGITQAVEQQCAALCSGFDKTTSGLTQETAALHASITRAVEQQLSALSSGFDKTAASFTHETASLHTTITQAVEQQLGALSSGFDKTTSGLAQETASLHANITQAVEQQLIAMSSGFDKTATSLTQETASLHTTVTQAVERQLEALSNGFDATTTNVKDIWQQALAQHQQQSDALATDLHGTLESFTQTIEQRCTGLVDGIATRLDATSTRHAQAWGEVLANQQATGEQLASQNQQALASAASAFEQHAASFAQTVDRSHADLQTKLAANDQQRLAAWSGALDATATALRDQWHASGAQTAAQQREICEALARMAHDVSSETATHARSTIAEIAQLVEAASQAPKAAADVICELREKLADSMARDTATLDERSRLLATVETLLDAVNHASSEQRTAIDALVATSADLLARVGAQFTDNVETETAKLGGIAAQVTGSAVEVASLGEAFGLAVNTFGASNEKLMTQLQRIETALDKSLARSDEQLAYYVAQAREVIDLSILSQKQIVEDLQQLAGRRAAAGAAA